MRACHICSESYEAGTYRFHKRTHDPVLYTVRRGKRADIARKTRLSNLIHLGMTLQELATIEGCTRQNVAQLVGGARSIRPPRGPRPAVDQESRAIRRFWSRVSVDASGCWLWTGARDGNGYGHSSRRFGSVNAHRAVYQMIRGEIPAGLQLDHLCRVRSCVNPDHLEPVTSLENIMRSPIAPAAMNARKTECKRGHPFDDANTIVTSNGRSCRTCRRTRPTQHTAAYRARKSAYDRARHLARTAA